ncbi:hypothetical protein LJC61_03010 [Ruminococcaceae bacterium OttesenSCG-928-A16]|nr:hypothetical protein [Ruminococcaceae bacterium OttesenSCG-928-A16]
MKTFWKQTAWFGGVLVAVAAIVLIFFYANGVGSHWVLHQLGAETDKRIVGGDTKTLQNIIAECEQTPATKAQIEEYTTTSEWSGFVFTNTTTRTVYAFSQNLGMMAVYQEPEAALPQSGNTQDPLLEIEEANFSYYQCKEEALQKIEGMYTKYFK